MKYENISLMIAQEIVSKMMEKNVDEMGKALFPNLPEERPQMVLAMKKLSVYPKSVLFYMRVWKKLLKYYLIEATFVVFIYMLKQSQIRSGYMKRYIALLREINISGKNKVVMAELKKEFESLKFEDVKEKL